MSNIKIYWIYFPNEKLGEYIRNESNNENWPSARKYLEINKDYFQQIKKWKEAEENNQKIKEIIANIQKWFRMEGLAILRNKGKEIRPYTIEDIRPLLKETKLFPRIGEFYHKFITSNSVNIIKEIKILELELAVAYKKRAGEIPLESWETEAGLKQCIKELTEKIKNLKCKSELWNKFRVLFFRWYNINESKGIESHISSNIYVERRDGEKIIFHWKVPNQKFNEIYNYLFYFYGEWREPILWEVVDYETARITASFSQFYNHYWHLLKSEVNGIIEHSPLLREEVCECPDFNSTPVFADFTSDYRLPLALFRAKGGLGHAIGTTRAYSTNLENPVVTSLELEPAANNDSVAESLKLLWDQAVGTCFFLLGNKYKPSNPISVDYHSNNRWENGGDKSDIHDWLKSYGLLEPDMEEILRKHIKATLYWRDKHIWQGNYWLLHNQFSVKESINPSGNSVNICGSGMVITKVTESITAKIGGNAFVSKFVECSIDLSLRDEKGQNNRQTERAVLSDNRKVSEDHWQSKSITINRTPGTKESNVSKANRVLKSGTGFLTPNLYNVDHTKSEYTMDQFLHRNWFVKDSRPLKLRVEVDQKLINWYRNKRELIGKTGQDFYNGPIANLLNVPGYLQMKVLTSNFPFSHWFRNRLEGGINIWGEDFKEIYQKKLSNPMAIASIGDIRHNSFEVVIITKSITVGSGDDNYSHAGEGLWIYKLGHGKIGGSQLWVIKDGQKTDNLFPWLMDELHSRRQCINKSPSDKWVLFHPQNWEEKIDIPSKYLTNTEQTSEGRPTCQIHFVFDFYTSGDNSREGDKLFATHFTVKRESFGNKGVISVEIVGNLEYTRTVGDPSGIPPTIPIPGAGITPTITDPEPFDPNIEIPQSVIGDPTAPAEQGGMPIEVPIEPPTEPPMEIPTEIPVEIPLEPPFEPPIEPTEPPVEPTEPPKENPLDNENEDE